MHIQRYDISYEFLLVRTEDDIKIRFHLTVSICKYMSKNEI